MYICVSSTVVDTMVETSRSSQVNTSSVGPDVEVGGRCASVDSAGHVMEDGQSWWDGCRRCVCHDGHEMCALITCPSLRCVNPVLRADSCCPSCPGTTLPHSLTVSALYSFISCLYGGQTDSEGVMLLGCTSVRPLSSNMRVM